MRGTESVGGGEGQDSDDDRQLVGTGDKLQKKTGKWGEAL